MGITNKHQKLLEEQVNTIDNLLLEQGPTCATEKGKKLKKFGCFWKKRKDLKKTYQSLKDAHDNPSTSDNEKAPINKRLSDIRNDHVNLIRDSPGGAFSIKKSDMKGPLCTHIDIVLEKSRIKKQAYHGGTFTGNHCHRYLKDKVFEHLTSDIKNVADK